MNKSFKSGYISLIGKPNAGKSTLMNLLLGEKLSITAAKPQTTRNKIQTILTGDDFQMVFLDTPGMHDVKNELDSYMLKSIESTFKEADICLLLIEPTAKTDPVIEKLIEKVKKAECPVFLVINKTDKVAKENLLKVIDVYSKKFDFKEIIPVSALKGDGKELLMSKLKEYLPEGPLYYPEDMITLQTEREIVSEIIREKALYLLSDEVPHGIAVEIASMKKREDKELYDIDATIICEKSSHKGIIIGKQGSMLKKIGSTARYAIEKFLGCKVNLKLWVKVKKDWRSNDFLVKELGYDKKLI